MPSPNVSGFFDTGTNTISYVVSDPSTGQCAVIDSVLDYDAASGRTDTRSADQLLEHIRSGGYELRWILETHAHADHLTAAPYIKSEMGGTIGIGHQIVDVQSVFGTILNLKDLRADGSQFDRLFSDGDTFDIGELAVTVLHTPGHTPACVTYVVGDAAFVGDTMFMPDYGTARCDFPGGDSGLLFDSMQKILTLPDETRLFMCHDYKAPGRDEFAWETTVAAQRSENVHLKDGVTRDGFAAFRDGRDAGLNMPKLLLPAIQVNIRAGEMPLSEDNGIAYLKIPLNAV